MSLSQNRATQFQTFPSQIVQDLRDPGGTAQVLREIAPETRKTRGHGA